MPNTSATEVAKPARAGARAAAHEAVWASSPGKEEQDEKNQDRLLLKETDDGAGAACQYAIVCDGTSTSPFSAEAAEHVSQRLEALFEEGGLRQAVEALRRMRLELLAKPVQLGDGYSELLRGMLEEVVREKYRSSYQTTFVAVRLRRDENAAGRVSVKGIGCGDSALFIFRESGELLFNNVNLGGGHERFKHGSPITAVLPDSYQEEEARHVLFDAGDYPADVHLLLCSDGLYDGFTNFEEIRVWLNEHRAELSERGGDAECVAELHRNLGRGKGDDDISFVWLRPAASPPEEVPEEVPEGRRGEEGEQTIPESPAGRRPGLFARLWASIRGFLTPRAG